VKAIIWRARSTGTSVERGCRWGPAETSLPAVNARITLAQGPASFACRPGETRGRLHPEPDSPFRTAFQRDRDRVIHSTAFRRLKHKTQVFVYHEGDHYRTRLTHSIEVAQIARTLARSLGVDEDLAEVVALAHDLGHTPFGHTGEDALAAVMAAYGGFDHNAQTLRILTKLEQRYAAFDGLNLTWETLEGLVKHNGPLVDAEGNPTAPYRDKGVPAAIIEYAEAHDLQLASFASLEAQVAAIADDIAYNGHDIDDGLRARLFDIIDLGDVPLVGAALADVLRKYPEIERPRLIHETVRRVISAMVNDVLAETQHNIRKSGVRSAADVRAAGRALAAFSAQMAENNRMLQQFLRERMYRHERVLEVMDRARRILANLFNAYMNDPKLLPAEWSDEIKTSGGPGLARQVSDFLAGMTDRYALEEHKRLFDLEPLSR